jgi:hypothetical protein
MGADFSVKNNVRLWQCKTSLISCGFLVWTEFQSSPAATVTNKILRSAVANMDNPWVPDTYGDNAFPQASIFFMPWNCITQVLWPGHRNRPPVSTLPSYGGFQGPPNRRVGPVEALKPETQDSFDMVPYLYNRRGGVGSQAGSTAGGEFKDRRVQTSRWITALLTR